jgi:hypothetical protein
VTITWPLTADPLSWGADRLRGAPSELADPPATSIAAARRPKANEKAGRRLDTAEVLAFTSVGRESHFLHI